MFSWNEPPMTTTEFSGHQIGTTIPWSKYVLILPFCPLLHNPLFHSQSIDWFVIIGLISPFKVGQHQRIPSATMFTLKTTWGWGCKA